MKRLLIAVLLSVTAAAAFGQTPVIGAGTAPYPLCTGTNVPCVLIKTGQTAAISATTFYTTSTAGVFRISTWVRVTSVNGTSGGTVSTNFVYNDGTGAQASMANASATASTTNGSTSHGTFFQAAGQPIQYRLDFGSIVGGPPTASAVWVLERLN